MYLLCPLSTELMVTVLVIRELFAEEFLALMLAVVMTSSFVENPVPVVKFPLFSVIREFSGHTISVGLLPDSNPQSKSKGTLPEVDVHYQ